MVGGDVAEPLMGNLSLGLQSISFQMAHTSSFYEVWAIPQVMFLSVEFCPMFFKK